LKKELISSFFVTENFIVVADAFVCPRDKTNFALYKIPNFHKQGI